MSEEALVERRQVAMHAARKVNPLGTMFGISYEVTAAIEAATQVRITEEVLRAARAAAETVSDEDREGARIVLTAAFRAAGFEVVE